MIPYILFIAFATFCCFCEISELNQLLKHILYFLFLLFTALLVGLRSETMGFDTPIYAQSFFEVLNEKPLTDQFEIGYLLLVKAFQNFSPSFNGFLLIVAFISLGLKFYAVPRFAPFVFIPMVYYLCYFLTEYEMSAVRQSLAMAFAFLAIYYAKNRNLYIFTALIAIGSFFHVSLIFFFPFYFLNRVKISYTYFALLIGCSALLFFVDLTAIVWKIISILPAGSLITEKVSAYMEGDSNTGLSLAHIPYLLFAIFFFYYAHIIKDPFYQHVFAAFIIGLFFSFLFSSTLGVLNRLTYYYLMTGGILFSYIIYYTQHRFNKIVYLLLLCSFAALKIMESILAAEAKIHYIPYKTFLS